MSERSDRMLYELSAYIRNMNVGQNYKELIDNIDNVKPEDITKATKTLKKKNVFMFRGDAK
jgi:predicted Zn-dependent peptidase